MQGKKTKTGENDNEREFKDNQNFKKIYNSVMKQLKQFNLYDKEGSIIKFQSEAIIG